MNQEELLRSALNLRGKTVLVTALDLNTGTFAKAFLRRVIGVDMIANVDSRLRNRLSLILDCSIEGNRMEPLEPRLQSYKSISFVPSKETGYNGEFVGELVPDLTVNDRSPKIICTFQVTP